MKLGFDAENPSPAYRTWVSMLSEWLRRRAYLHWRSGCPRCLSETAPEDKQMCWKVRVYWFVPQRIWGMYRRHSPASKKF